jgi:putative inorganic carbon (hco3(-)) transporter
LVKKISETLRGTDEGFLSGKIAKPVVYAMLFFVSIGLALIISSSSITVSAMFLIFSLGLPVAIISFVYPRVGFLISIGITYFIIFIKRVIHQYDAPVGIIVEGVLYISAIGALFRTVVKKDISFHNLKNPLAIVILIWLAYHLLQAFNPSTYSLTGWIVTIREVTTFLMFYLLALYSFNDFKFIKLFTYFWVGLAVVAALYAIYQEYVGLPEFDLRWVYSSEARFKLNFIWGRFRKWSFLSDCANLGVFMAFSSIFTMIMLMGPYSLKKKIVLFIITVLLCMAMAFSGTRTAYAMVPVGVIVFIMMTINNYKTLLFAFSFILIFVFLIFGPIENPVLNRVRSAFDEDDPSLQVRNENRKTIQPYILEHPIGGGLSTTGDSGLKYSPQHELAGFPSDSGFLRTALEMGWIGLVLQLLLYATSSAYGIYIFYKTKQPEVKIMLAAYVAASFAFTLANFSQVATKMPIGPILYSVYAVFIQLGRLNASDSK